MALQLFSQAGVNGVKQILDKRASLVCCLPGGHTILACCKRNVTSHSSELCTGSSGSQKAPRGGKH